MTIRQRALASESSHAEGPFRSDVGGQFVDSVDPVRQTTILIADDHLLVAEAVAGALACAPHQFLTRIVSTLSEALVELGSGVQFDLVLLDIKMPGMRGLKSVEAVIAAAAPSPVVLMSGQADRSFVQSAVKRGARGLIPKTLPLRSFVSVIDFVLSDQIFLPADGSSNQWNADAVASFGLSERELTIVRLLSDGRTNKEIAHEFDGTETNVKMHMRAICRKLEARNRAHVVTIGKERGLI
jgi:two-component system nitrate/nitrite response regulator NarP